MVRTQDGKLDKYLLSFFIIFMTVYFLESIGGFYMTTAVVSIEKQFQIPSKTSGTMVSAGDFGYIPSVVFVAYLGGKGNRARWIGMGCILIALANILISSSNFLFSDKVVNTTSNIDNKLYDENGIFNCTGFIGENDALEMMNHNNGTWCEAKYKQLRPNLLTSSFAFCNPAINYERAMISEYTCRNHQMDYIGPTTLIFFGLIILGIGRTMPFSLGLPLVDDNVKKQNLPLYFAGMFLFRLTGPIVGFGMGTYFNTLYYKFEKPIGLTTTDPDWIGRWWAGFLCIGVVLFFPSLALFCFPTPKPSDYGTKTNLVLVDKHAKKDHKGEIIMPTNAKSKVKDFVETITGVLKQPVYTGAMIGRILDVFTFKGFFVFLPKYVEVQFGLPQYKINMMMGIIGIFGFAIGVLLGTITMKKLKLEGRRAATYVAVCSAIAAIMSYINAGVGCHSTLTTLGKQLPEKLNISLPCNNNCNCYKTSMFPVCDITGEVFYSPCHAGCNFGINEINIFQESQKEGIIFTNCSCSTIGDVSRQFCQIDECEKSAYMYFMFLALGGLVGGMGVTPSVLILLRSVPPEHRSISLGFNGFLVSLLATLPSPIVWGWIIDQFCIKWEQKCPNTKGSCSLYDAENLRIYLHVIYGTLRVIALITDIFVIYHAKGLKLTEEDIDIDENPDKTNSKIKLETSNANDPLIGAIEMKHRRQKSSDDKSRKSSFVVEIMQNEIAQHGAP